MSSINNSIKNVKIYTECPGTVHGMSIVLDFSGQREYLMHYRHNGVVYLTFRNGVRIEELRRMSRNGRDPVLNHFARHMIKIVDEYIKYERVGVPDAA